MKKRATKVAHNQPRPFYFTVQPRTTATAQNWFFILWNLGTRHLFSYLLNNNIVVTFNIQLKPNLCSVKTPPIPLEILNPEGINYQKLGDKKKGWFVTWHAPLTLYHQRKALCIPNTVFFMILLWMSLNQFWRTFIHFVDLDFIANAHMKIKYVQKTYLEAEKYVIYYTSSTKIQMDNAWGNEEVA